MNPEFIARLRKFANDTDYSLYEDLFNEAADRLTDAQDVITRLGDGTNSYKYKAELYDEVWEKATGMGYSNVTMALAELAAIKAQGPVAEVALSDDGYKIGLLCALRNHRLPLGTKLYAAPVSEDKAHGNYAPDSVVWIDAHHVIEGNNPSFIKDVALVSAERTSETQIPLARLNGAPVQQVSVPDVSAMARILADRNADAYNVNREDNWAIYGQDYIDDVTAMLAAAPAAPAADAWIPVSERLPDVPDGDEREVIVCVKRAHNGQSYSFSARYLNNFPLHSDSEDEPAFVTGWYDVKEHAEYDGWYSPLIDSSSGDEVTHWMPLPAAPSANSDKGVV